MDIPIATFENFINAFSHGLVEGYFFKSLVKNPLIDYDDLLGRVEKYINMEEAQHVR